MAYMLFGSAAIVLSVPLFHSLFKKSLRRVCHAEKNAAAEEPQPDGCPSAQHTSHFQQRGLIYNCRITNGCHKVFISHQSLPLITAWQEGEQHNRLSD